MATAMTINSVLTYYGWEVHTTRVHRPPGGKGTCSDIPHHEIVQAFHIDLGLKTSKLRAFFRRPMIRFAVRHVVAVEALCLMLAKRIENDPGSHHAGDLEEVQSILENVASSHGIVTDGSVSGLKDREVTPCTLPDIHELFHTFLK